MIMCWADKPSSSNFLYDNIGPKKLYKYYGFSAAVVQFKDNHLIIISEGKTTVEFKDGHTTVMNSRLTVKISGLMVSKNGWYEII